LERRRRGFDDKLGGRKRHRFATFRPRADPFLGIKSNWKHIYIRITLVIAVVGEGDRQEFVLSAGREEKDGVRSTEKLNLQELEDFEQDIDYPGGEIVAGASVNLE